MGLTTSWESTTDSPTSTNTLTSNGITNSSTPTPPINNRLTDGAVAGIAIGCLIVGLLIGIICGWLLRRFARTRSRYHRRIRAIKISRDPDTGGSMAPDSTEKTLKLESFILQATPDKEVVSMLRRLEVIIEQHVESYYHAKPIDTKVPILAQALANLGINKNSSGFEAETVAGWCLQPGSRRLGLQHVISHVLFSSIDCNSRTTPTMLPGPVSAFLRSIRPVEQYREEYDVMSVVLTRWRTLSALLLHPTPNERTPLGVSELTVRDQALDLANGLDTFLSYFVVPDQGIRQKQQHHLHLMIIDAAKLGYALFSHTSDWRFIYKDEMAQRGLVICVGLEKSVGMAETLTTVGAVVNALRLTYQLATLAIASGKVKGEVRRSLELVRTCERDLQHLIGLREEYLDILERKPAELDRANTIIKAAHQGLAEVCKIVEKCRPEADQGKIPFKGRSRWMFLDSTEFYTQIPIVSSHHRAVLSEISFLRQIALQAPVPVRSEARDEKAELSRKKTVAIDNIALLGNLMGAKRHSIQGHRDSVPDSSSLLLSDYLSDGCNAQSSQPPSYQAVNTTLNTALNPTTQRSLALTHDTSDTQFAQEGSQEISYTPNRFLNSADIQETRRDPNTLHDDFRPVPFERTQGLTLDLHYIPNLPLPISPSLEDQPRLMQSQTMQEWTHVSSTGLQPPLQHHRPLSPSQYSNASCPQNAFPVSFTENEVERTCTPAPRARPPIPPKILPNDSTQGYT
ncbi:hypothetical protein F53441_12601 [Fusarium austroafricanum]|uniref:Uncharacterized protein n=1 Tax=Fusarium austroafricanum TaxID=2364996 RepID=A0A8H4JYR5_9HYPO|nr:hypothetical protein F53441_12601 [Fusarium austroafricanum]